MKKTLHAAEYPAGCSCMMLTSKCGRVYWFRTCDLEKSVWEAGAHLVSFPAGGEIPLYGKDIRTRFSLMGITFDHRDSRLLDGINSAGLTGGLLLLEEGTSVRTPSAGYDGVMGMELVTVLLSTCRDVGEVCRAAKAIQITDIPTESGHTAATMHYYFMDAAGKSVVLEAADDCHPGCLTVYHADSIGILTNSPPYPQQLDNLRWFLSQSPELHHGGNNCPITQPAWEGVMLPPDPSAPHMTASGVLPASYAPYDRFVRLAVMKALNHDGRTIEDAQMLPLGAGILRTVIEPRNGGVYHYRSLDAAGMPIGRSDGYTQYTVMYDLSQRRLFLMPYDSTAWTLLTLSECSPYKTQYHAVEHGSMAGVVRTDNI